MNLIRTFFISFVCCLIFEASIALETDLPPNGKPLTRKETKRRPDDDWNSNFYNTRSDAILSIPLINNNNDGTESDDHILYVSNPAGVADTYEEVDPEENPYDASISLRPRRGTVFALEEFTPLPGQTQNVYTLGDDGGGVTETSLDTIAVPGASGDVLYDAGRSATDSTDLRIPHPDAVVEHSNSQAALFVDLYNKHSRQMENL